MVKKNTGVTLHKIDSGIDTGNIIDQAIFQVDKKITARDSYINILKLGMIFS